MRIIIPDCCDTYEIRGNGHHPFAKDISKVFGIYKRQTELYYDQTPIWKLQSDDSQKGNVFLYKSNDGIHEGASKVGNFGKGYWNIGPIEGGWQHWAYVHCYSFAAAFDWCPHRVKYCHPNQNYYAAEDIEPGIEIFSYNYMSPILTEWPLSQHDFESF